MSTKISGLRRVGIVGLSTLVATSMMTGFAATASATAGDYAAVTAENVVQGSTTKAGNVTLAFANDFAVGSTQTFQIKRGSAENVCSTASGLAAAVEFNGTPTVSFGTVLNAAGTAAGTAANSATAGPVVLSSSTTACSTNGIQDVATVTMTSASTAPLTDTWKATLTVDTYGVGATAAVGPVALVTAGDLVTGPASVNNANVVAVSNFSVSPVITAQSSSTGTALGTASFTETTAGGLFAPNVDTTVVLTHSTADNFTTGVLPTITVPTGWTATAGTLTAASFTFVVHPPAAAAAGTVSVSGLKIDTVADGYLVTLTGTRTGVVSGTQTVNAAKVVDYNDRTGGIDRYATAAALFDGQFPLATTAVLSSGFDFPDALSANYLAGRLNTGTLLTRPTTLSGAARLSLLTGHAATVYVTGETGAISAAVVSQVEALHVNNNPALPFITVVRLGGANRYVTNKIINENSFVTSGTVLLASGEDFADALALGPIAADKEFPLILTKGKTLGANELTQLADFAPTKVIIGGGVGPVSAAIAADLTARGYTVTRLWGADRTLTSQAIATWGTTLAPAPLFLSRKTYIARGDDFGDALAAGPVAGAQHYMITLSKNLTTLGVGIPAYLATKTVDTGTVNTHADSLHALGLSGAVTNAMMRAAAVTVGP